MPMNVKLYDEVIGALDKAVKWAQLQLEAELDDARPENLPSGPFGLSPEEREKVDLDIEWARARLETVLMIRSDFLAVAALECGSRDNRDELARSLRAPVGPTAAEGNS